MSLSVPLREELHRLCYAYHEGQITPAEASRLESLVLKNPNACQFFIESQGLIAHLEWEATQKVSPFFFDGEHAICLSKEEEKEAGDKLVSLNAKQRQRNYSSRRNRIIGICSACLGVILLSVFLQLVTFSKRDKHVLVVGQQNATWSLGNSPSESAGKIFIGEKKQLIDGIVELHFPSGAKTYIRGPAAFEVLGKNELLLEQGTILAAVETEKAKGFAVTTPSSVNVDFGTVFGVSVNEAGTSVTQVFKGKVKSHNKINSDSTEQAEAITLITGGNILHQTDGVSHQQPSNYAEYFYVTFHHFTHNNNEFSAHNSEGGLMANRIANLFGMTANEYAVKVDQIRNDASVEQQKRLTSGRGSALNEQLYCSLSSEQAIQRAGGLHVNHADDNFSGGQGVEVKAGDRLSFNVARKLNKLRGKISFQFKPNWNGANDLDTEEYRYLISSSESLVRNGLRLFKFRHTNGQNALVFRFDDGGNNGMKNEVFEPSLQNWVAGTWYTIEAEWDLTLPAGEQYLKLTIDGVETAPSIRTWEAVQNLGDTVAIGTNSKFSQAADGTFRNLRFFNTSQFSDSNLFPAINEKVMNRNKVQPH